MRALKAVATIASTAAVVALAGCGSVNKTGADTGPDTASAACKSTAGITGDTVKLGVISDLSGPVAVGGVPFANGLRAYIDYANASLNSVGGHKVAVDVQDSQYDTQKALNEYRSMRNAVAAMPMIFGTDIMASIAPLAVQDCLAAISNAGSVTDQRPNVFFAGPTVEDQVINVLDWYVNHQHHSGAKVAIFAQTGAAGNGIIKAATAASKQFGFKIVAKQQYAQTDKSFQGQLSAISAAKPDVVLMGNAPLSAITFFGEAEAAGATWDYIGTQGDYTPSVFGLPIGKAFEQKVHLAYGGPLFDANTAETKQATEQLGKFDPKLAKDPTSLIGWEAGVMIYQALTNAAKGGLTRGSIESAMAHLSMPGVGTSPIAYDPNGSAPGVPFHGTAIVQPDKSAPGGLKIVSPFAASAFIDSYYSQSK